MDQYLLLCHVSVDRLNIFSVLEHVLGVYAEGNSGVLERGYRLFGQCGADLAAAVLLDGEIDPAQEVAEQEQSYHSLRTCVQRHSEFQTEAIVQFDKGLICIESSRSKITSVPLET